MFKILFLPCLSSHLDLRLEVVVVLALGCYPSAHCNVIWLSLGKRIQYSNCRRLDGLK